MPHPKAVEAGKYLNHYIMCFKDLVFNPVIYNGKCEHYQAFARFSNNYGVSVLKGTNLTTEEQPYELAVIEFKSSDNSEFKLVYPDYVNEDVCILTAEGVELFMGMVETYGLKSTRKFNH